MEFSQLVVERRSVKSYHLGRFISDAELKEVFEEVILSPSSFNLQHWAFIAVRNSETRKRLKEAAWGQQQVEDASVTLLVCGKLDAYKDAPKIYEEAPRDIQEKMLPMIEGFYEGKDRAIRDEAIRSASLAAMTLMYSATARGWGSCAMIGFDPEAVTKVLKLTPNYIPVMMLVLGHQKDTPRPRPYRRPVSEVVRMESLEGPGLMES
jgi:nitroreductase